MSWSLECSVLSELGALAECNREAEDKASTVSVDNRTAFLRFSAFLFSWVHYRYRDDGMVRT